MIMTDSAANPRKLSRADRIRSSADFRTLMRQGRRSHAGPLRVRVTTETPRTRLGLAVSKRAGGAVRRNRIKRHLRTAFRNLRNDWPKHIDVLVIVSDQHPETSFQNYAEWFDRAVRDACRWPKDQS